MAPSLPDRPDAIFLQDAPQDAAVRLRFAEEAGFRMRDVGNVVTRYDERCVVEQNRDPLSDQERLPVPGVSRAGPAAGTERPDVHGEDADLPFALKRVLPQFERFADLDERIQRPLRRRIEYPRNHRHKRRIRRQQGEDRLPDGAQRRSAGHIRIAWIALLTALLTALRCGSPPPPPPRPAGRRATNTHAP